MRTIVLRLSLVFIFFVPWEGVIELPGMGTATKLIGFAVAACWLATVVITNRFRKPRPFHVIVYLFVLWNAVSVLWSTDPDRTVVHLRTWAQLLGLVIIVWELYTTRAALLAGLQAFILGEYVAISKAIYNFFSGNVFYTHYQRFSPSEQSNPDGFGIIVALGIPVAWYLASSKSATKMSGLLKFVNYAYIPAAFVGLALSGTRTALIAAIPGMAFGLASLSRPRPAVRLAIFLLLTSTILILLPHVRTLRSFQRLGTTYAELTEGDLNNRTNNWREGLASFAEHPLIGVGSNMYRSVNSLGKLAHNSFLSVLVELGLIGFALFGMILTFAVIRAWGQPKWEARFWLTTLLVWAIGASSLTYEHRKATWLFLSLVVASAALTSHRDEIAPLVQRDKSVGQFVRQAKMNELPQGE
ncbi:MAG: O-antigen ligase family protein [Ardenticatenaceae bacterium]|nr:O-antigen ligase family protein [Ardenticatenaceae bacterium]